GYIGIIVAIVLCFLVGFICFKSSGNTQKKESNNKPKTTNKTTTVAKNEEKNDKSEAKLTFIGDLMFEQPFYDATPDIEKSNYFDLVNPYFKDDDITVGNLEVVIGNDKLQTSGTGYSFCAPQTVGKLVANQSIEVLSTANNHAYDRSVDGVNSTIDFFKDNTSIMTVGTFKQESDREKVQSLEVNGIKIGFLAYTLGTNSKMKIENRFRVNLYRDQNTKLVDDAMKAKIKADVERTKKATDVTIVLIHWGTEFTNTPNVEQETMANYLNSLGVDIVVGNHAHAIQPIKYIGKEKKTLVYYALGNFTSADDDVERTGEKFDNADQFGLLSTLKITKENDKISIGDITT
ncbi:MAG: CapA family protein, partial [Bacilli bacterium]|nr:CapA family protein [Bacilli bacterium]